MGLLPNSLHGTGLRSDLQIRSHMLMQDKNNLQIADLMLKWIDENVGKQKVAKK